MTARNWSCTRASRMGAITVDCINGQDSVKFILTGRIDSTNAYKFYDAVCAVIDIHPVRDIEFDCRGLEYISSLGLRVFLSMQKKKRILVKLVNVSHEVWNILTITGMTQIFDVSGGSEQ